MGACDTDRTHLVVSRSLQDAKLAPGEIDGL